MLNITIESKKLALQLRENEDKYIMGQLDLAQTLEKTDELFHQALEDNQEEPTTANKILHDSALMKLQTRLARQCAKYYKPDSLVFNPVEFSTKLKQFYGQNSASQRNSSSSKLDELLWMTMGDFAKKNLHTVPTFNFIHGTFDPDPVEVVKKKRKMKEKDKIGDATKPQSMSLNESLDNQDIMITEAQRVLTVFHKVCQKSEENVVCYFEFVTDPTSFARTVENIFIMSLLVKEGLVRIIKDGNGLPCLTNVRESERKQRNPAEIKQCIVSISLEEWQDIVKTFKFKTPLIPPRKSSKNKKSS